MRILLRITILLALLLSLTSQVLADPPSEVQVFKQLRQPPYPLQQPPTISPYGMDILGPAWQWTFPREYADPRLDGAIRIDQLDEVIAKSWDAGVRSARVAAWWCFLEPERDQYEWEDMDIMVQLLSNYGMEPIPEILYTPYWARADAPQPQNSCIDNWRRNYGPDDISDWDEFMGEFVQRYGATGKNQVRYWEIWNEPDLPEFLSRDPGYEDETVCIYSELLRSASQQIRSQNPEDQIILGGLSDINGPGFLDDLLDVKCELDVRNDFDILAFHAFTQHDLKIFYLMRVLEKHNASDRYELWLNEFNNISWGKDYDKADDRIDDLFDLVFDAEVTRTFWFKAWTTKWQADWTVGIFMERDPLWVPGSFVPSPFFKSYKRQSSPYQLAGAPDLAVPVSRAVVSTHPSFTWQSPTPGSFPIVGYKLQVDDSTYQGIPYFHAPEIDAWVTPNTLQFRSFLPLQIGTGLKVNAVHTIVSSAPSGTLTSSNISYTSPEQIAPGRYFWRVAAVDTEGNVGPYSETRIMHIEVGPDRTYLPILMR